MKENIFKCSKILIVIAALGQLALSQVHIDVITKVFASEIGLYLFLFIIFGVVLAFNTNSKQSGIKFLLTLFTSFAASFMGFKYIQLILLDIKNQTLLTMNDASLSLTFSVITILVYLIGVITIFFTRNYDD